MKRIVERCPTCGVEHENDAATCEACGAPLRHWCRTHSRELGWLDDAWCIRCEEEEARRTGRPMRPRPVVAAAPALPPVSVPPAPPPSTAPEAAPPRPYLRFDRSPRAPVETSAAAPVVTPVATAPMVPATPAEVPAAAAPEAASKRSPGPLARTFDGVLTATWWGIVFALVGVAVGAFLAYRVQGNIPRMAAEWGVVAGAGGLVLGGLAALGRTSRPNPPER